MELENNINASKMIFIDTFPETGKEAIHSPGMRECAARIAVIIYI